MYKTPMIESEERVDEVDSGSGDALHRLWLENHLYELINECASFSDLLSKDPEDKFATCTESLLEARDLLKKR